MNASDRTNNEACATLGGWTKTIALVWTMLLVPVRAVVAAPPPPDPKLNVPFAGPIALAVLDARPDIVSGDRKETYIGFTRTFYGVPVSYHTRSKKPFAQDLSALISRALTQGGTPGSPGGDRHSPQERGRTPDPARNSGLVVGDRGADGSAL